MRIRNPRVAIYLVLWFAFLAAHLRGQDVAVNERTTQGLEQDFLLRVWETADGLLPTTVRSIAQTRDGYVWLAANDGFVRFDGVRAVIFSGRNSPGLPNVPKGTKVFADSAGRLWAATTEGRLFSFDQVAWREYRQAHGWRDFLVESIAESASGRLIFSGASKLMQFSDGVFQPVALPELPGDFRPPLKAVFDPAGKLWLTSPSHVWREEADGWKLVTSAGGSGFHGAAPARESGVWIATSKEVRKYVGDTVVATLVRPEGFLSEDLVLLEDFHGNVWGGSATKGLRIWTTDGRVVKAGHSADSLSPQIISLFEDRERNVLVGTDGAGLARFKPRPFTAWFGQLGGLAGALINSVGEDSGGRILVGTEGSGLRRVGGETPPALMTTADGTLGRRQRITSLLRTHDGEMIAAVASKGLFRMEGDKAVPLPADTLKGELIRALFEDSHGRLWIGHDHGITVRENGNFTRLQPGTAPVLTSVRAIAEDHEGTMWFVGKEGLARSRQGSLELVPLPALSTRTNLLGLFVDHAGALWIGAETKGLLRLHKGHAFLYTAAHGLPITSAGAFLEEGDYLWVSGEKGIVRISHASLDAVAEKQASRLELQLFNRADGLPSDACRRGYQPVAFKASDGQLWFATHKGAISVHPQDITQAVFEPSASIEEIRAELAAVVVTPANRERIDIPAGTRHMTIRCSVPSLGKPDYARFQYTLEGFDDVWRDAGSERVIRFYDVQPGKYRFSVRAIGTDGRFVEQPSSVVLIVHPLFWQEWWFRALCLAALVFAVGFVVWRSQQQHIRLQEEKLQAQKTQAELEMQLQQAQKMDALGRLAGGIAHDFNNLLTSVGGNAELLQAELPAASRQREIVNDIAAAAGRARELVSQILTFSRRRAVEKTALDPAPILREAVQLLRAGLPAMIELQADVPDKLPPILGDAAQVQRIIMNLGTNAAQAIGAQTGHIRIGAQECRVKAEAPVDGVPSGRYLRLVVSDDGRGMDDRTLSRIFDPFFTTKAIGHGTGLGLSVVHGIVEAYGGHITVESEPADGTVFQIYFPVTDQSPAPSTGESSTLAVSAPAASDAAILLVDDEAVVLKVSRAMLERLGYTVESYTDALAAAEAFAAQPERYRLLLTDFAMPKLDGVELARRIWRMCPGFPAILYTGYGGRLTAGEAERMGFVELLAKPFTMQKLGEAVAHALASPESAAVAGGPEAH
ncbi:MAG: two-component regulator propeller domain-containing protein [Chthoniobacter sp.]|uniref:two-component regulator propeller domain-containing protein n=1 Tax=Chthoniobacter sp. TaxID=2510640 RepID=UPI0032A88265